jgi:hypothetical protein
MQVKETEGSKSRNAIVSRQERVIPSALSQTEGLVVGNSEERFSTWLTRREMVEKLLAGIAAEPPGR